MFWSLRVHHYAMIALKRQQKLLLLRRHLIVQVLGLDSVLTAAFRTEVLPPKMQEDTA